MAIKPITNKNVVNKESINRGKQVSTRNQVARNGNRSQTIPLQSLLRSCFDNKHHDYQEYNGSRYSLL